MSRMPICSGLPMWTGAPCTAGNRVVICTARIASAGFSGRIERERAAEREGDEVVAPMVANVVGLVDQLAVLEHAVARHVGADVEILCELRQPPVARLADRQHRAGFWIELAEPQEIRRQLARQNCQVALHVTRRETRGRPAIAAVTDGRAGLLAGLET